MENTNPTGKSISELVKLAEEQQAQLLIIGSGNDEIKQAELIAKLKGKGALLIVSAQDLTEEDRKKIEEADIKPNSFERPALPITKLHEMPLPEIFVEDEKKTFFGGFNKRKKLKGWQKKR
jgi:hypothetical protein